MFGILSLNIQVLASVAGFVQTFILLQKSRRKISNLRPSLTSLLG